MIAVTSFMCELSVGFVAFFVYRPKAACGPFGSQPIDCFNMRAKGVAFARQHAGSSFAAFMPRSGNWDKSLQFQGVRPGDLIAGCTILARRIGMRARHWCGGGRSS